MGGDSDIARDLGAWRKEKTGYNQQFPETAQTDDMNNHDYLMITHRQGLSPEIAHPVVE